MQYFEESEFNLDGEPCFDKMNKHFIKKLDKARSFTTTPFTITSSWRSVDYEKSKGRSGTSSHCKGLACDISAKNSSDRYNIIRALLRANFTRIGVSKDFVHCDLDYDKPQELVWTY